MHTLRQNVSNKSVLQQQSNFGKMKKKKATCTKKRAYKHQGKGILNWLIKKTPFEMHIPGYQYCEYQQKKEKSTKKYNTLF